jgi:hypothetical protein
MRVQCRGEMSCETTSLTVECTARSRRGHRYLGTAAVAVAAAALAVAPSAGADANGTLRQAVTAARGTACPLRDDPAVEQTAEQVNAGIDRYTNHDARFVPEKDAMPLLRDLGYSGSKATMLFGAGKTEAMAIKGLLVEGFRAMPDCSYTDFGANAKYNKSKEMIFVTVVLAARA